MGELVLTPINQNRLLKLKKIEFALLLNKFALLQIGFPVVITLRVITRNTFFHLRRSITRNYAFITSTKERLVSRN